MKKSLQILLLLIINYSLLISNCSSQWVQQTVPVSKPITGIKFIDSLRGWACTSIGVSGANYAYILHTTNSGTNWFIQDSSFNTNYRALCVIDSNIIYSGGDSVGNGKLSKSTNGGLTWSYIGAPTDIQDMMFINRDSGYYCTGTFGADVRTTTNGGLSWTVRINGIASQTQRVFFLNYNTGFCGANTKLYKTTNAGINWILNNTLPGTPLGIFFFNETTGWLGLDGAMIASTTNGGTNWTTQHPFLTVSDNINDMYFINNNTGWAGTSWFQKILKTTNGGLNWGYQVVPTDSKRISIVDSLNAWAADLGISHTNNDGGQIIYTGLAVTGNTIPKSYNLYQNFPNPFNPATNIRFDVKSNTTVRLLVFDILGREIALLVNEKLKTGSYEYNFKSDNLPSGTYFYKLITDSYTETKKMILIK